MVMVQYCIVNIRVQSQRERGRRQVGTEKEKVIIYSIIRIATVIYVAPLV